MLRQWFISMMDHFAGFIVGNLLKISVIGSINQALMIHRLSKSMGRARTVLHLNMVLLLAGMFDLEAHPDPSSSSRYLNGKIMMPPCAAALRARDSLLRRVFRDTKRSLAVGADRGGANLGHNLELTGGRKQAKLSCRASVLSERLGSFCCRSTSK